MRAILDWKSNDRPGNSKRTRPSRGLARLCLLVCAAGAVISAAQAQTPRFTPQPVQLETLRTLRVSPYGVISDKVEPGRPERGCNVISTHTDADFGSGQFVAQAGFSETEIAAASYQLDPSEFPIKIDSIEMIFVTAGTTVATTTEWSVLVWEGLPNAGMLVAEFSSDGQLLPHIEMPAGTHGVNVLFSIDPNDPNQIIIDNTSGSNTFSVGYRIDAHNNQTQNPCIVPPPTTSNAFPATDTSGLQSPTGNWLWAINCGGLGCRAGWSPFSMLGICQPGGDWVLRSTWSSLNCQPGFGACCLLSGDCEILAETECLALSGQYQGDGTNCSAIECPEPVVACCFSGGACLDLLLSDCLSAGGAAGPPGSECATHECNPIGACCLPSGECIDGVSPAECEAQGGTFQGNATNCGSIECPDPIGACCFENDFCLLLTEPDCNAVPGTTWNGPGSDCADHNNNGTADVCEDPTCPADLNGDGVIDLADLGILLTDFGCAAPGPCVGDVDGDNDTDLADLGILLAAFGQVCP